MTSAGLVGVPEPSELFGRSEPGRDRGGGHLHARGDPAAPARDPGARLADRPRDAAPGRHRRRPEAPGDDRRGARAPRGPAARRRRRLRQRRGRRADRRARRRSRDRARDRLGGEGRCRCVPGIAAFGEIGLTGRLRAATQAERRVEECRKLGLGSVLAPAGTPGAAAGAETLRRALAPGSARTRPEQGFSSKSPANVAVFGVSCYPVVPRRWSLQGRRHFRDYRRKEEPACTRSATRWCIPTTVQARS